MNNKQDNQSGIAVILAIGLSSLLLALAVAFVSTAMIEKKASGNYQALSTARSAARTALNRALSIMKDAPMNVDLSALVSHQAAPAITDNEMLELEAVLNNTTVADLPSADSVYSFPSQPWDTSDSGLVTWVYLKSNYTNAADESCYLSRIAFVIMSDKGKLDISAIEDSGKNAGSSHEIPLELEGSPPYTMVDSNGNYVLGRPGRNPTEIFLNSVLNTAGGDNSWFGADTIRVLGVDGGSNPDTPYAQLLPGKRWSSFDNIFNAIERVKSYSTPIPDTAKNNFKEVFSVYEPQTPEAFWIDTNSDGYKYPNELYHRFNLARTDWDSLTVASFLDPDNVKPFSNSVTSSDSIPWLLYWSDKGDMNSLEAARNQIIANLIDYCDLDADATTDYNGNNIPTYFGLEKVPYINEIRIPISANLTKDAGTKTWQCTISVMNPGVEIELVNMYGDVPADTTVKLSIYISIRVNGTEVLTSYIYGDDVTTPAYSFLSVGYQKQAISTFFSIDDTTTGIYDLPELPLEAKVDTLIVEVSNALLPAKYYDFAVIRAQGTAQWLSLGDITDGVWQGKYIDFQVRDPRQNLLSSDWDVDTSVGTLEARNSNYPTSFSGSDTDIESDGAEPWELSTAYIRNAPMESPWELGFIHRAKAFQTLNLTEYAVTNSPSEGGSLYTFGDANILDQVKMSADTVRYGTVNLNSKSDTALAALFEYINIDSPSASTSISNDTARIIASTITGNNDTLFKTRAEILNNGEIANALFNADSNIQTTDSTREELIGKFINLAEASPSNIYYIIAVGQAIKDVKGGQSGTAEYLQYTDGVDQVLATQKILAVVKRDPVTNEFKIIRIEDLSN